MYDDKSSAYFTNIRSEILPLIPQNAARILEVGCGMGNTLAWIKSIRKCEWVCGIEISSDSADEANKRIDLVVQGDIEKIDFPVEFNSFDVILCLDVLEHLVDPWLVLSRLDKLLKPGGVIIASIPNVRNYRVVFPLFFRGQWEYKVEGILDKTHLRFFTKNSAISLMQSSGLKLDSVMATGLHVGGKSWFVNFLTLSIFKHFFESQYLIKVQKIV